MVIYSSPLGPIPVSSTPVHAALLEQIDAAIRKNPDKKAFIDGADSSKFVAYTEVKTQAIAVAQFLHNQRFQHQTACAVLPNCKEFFPFFLEVALQGGALSGGSSQSTECNFLFILLEEHIYCVYQIRKLEKQFKDCQCSIVLTDEASLGKVRNAAKRETYVKTIIVLSPSSLPSDGSIISWNQVISTPVQQTRQPVKINVTEDVVVLPYSRLAIDLFPI